MCEKLLFIFKALFHFVSLFEWAQLQWMCVCVCVRFGQLFRFFGLWSVMLCVPCLVLSCLEQTTHTSALPRHHWGTIVWIYRFVWNMFSISKHIIQFRWYAFQCIYAWDKNTNVIKHCEWCDYYLCSDNTRLDGNKTMKESKGKTLSISIQTQFSIRIRAPPPSPVNAQSN